MCSGASDVSQVTLRFCTGGERGSVVNAAIGTNLSPRPDRVGKRVRHPRAPYVARDELNRGGGDERSIGAKQDGEESRELHIPERKVRKAGKEARAEQRCRVAGRMRAR